ncbi:MAG: RNase adapter RapZ [Clostridiales bacterium]|nr:RNase adapter RapZ [Clostridiales bacterium]
MKFIIITGLSGSGKSHIVNFLEDLGFFCIDNMPPQLINKFAQIHYNSFGKVRPIAIICDIRSGSMFLELESALNELKKNGYKYDILFLEASDEVLTKRYKESRRRHPLALNGRILDGITRERKILDSMRKRATITIDTSNITTAQLAKYINSLCDVNKDKYGIVVNLISFGFKHGIPLDTDLLFDVRFLSNPFYVPELKNLTGRDKKVFDYVMNFEHTKIFLKKLENMIEFLIPLYADEGRPQIIVSIGCTGGHHRSVAIVEEMHSFLINNNHSAVILHRDEEKK